jgi:hypothetical protein
VVVVEALSRMMSATVNKGLLSGFFVGSKKKRMDNLIFGKASHEQLRHQCCLFLCCEAVSRLKINLSKSELVSIGDVVDL